MRWVPWSHPHFIEKEMRHRMGMMTWPVFTHPGRRRTGIWRQEFWLQVHVLPLCVVLFLAKARSFMQAYIKLKAEPLLLKLVSYCNQWKNRILLDAELIATFFWMQYLNKDFPFSFLEAWEDLGVSDIYWLNHLFNKHSVNTQCAQKPWLCSWVWIHWNFQNIPMVYCYKIREIYSVGKEQMWISCHPGCCKHFFIMIPSLHQVEQELIIRRHKNIP